MAMGWGLDGLAACGMSACSGVCGRGAGVGVRRGEVGGVEGEGLISWAGGSGRRSPSPPTPETAACCTSPPPCSLKSDLGRVASTFACKVTFTCERRGRISYSCTAKLRSSFAALRDWRRSSLAARSSRAVGGRGGSMAYSSTGPVCCGAGGRGVASPPTSSCRPLLTFDGNLVASFFRVLSAYFISSSSSSFA